MRQYSAGDLVVCRGECLASVVSVGGTNWHGDQVYLVDPCDRNDPFWLYSNLCREKGFFSFCELNLMPYYGAAEDSDSPASVDSVKCDVDLSIVL